MRIAPYIAAVLLVPGVVALCPAQTSAPTVRLEDFERTRGPLKVAGKSFTVLLRGKRLNGVRSFDPDLHETVTAISIVDPQGKAHFQKTLPYEVAGERFLESTGVDAAVLEGTNGSGLLLTYGTLPSAPLGGRSWQVFGLIGDDLVAFEKPFTAEGDLASPKPGGPPRLVADAVLKADVMEVRVWAGNFFVIAPLRIDWIRGMLAPAWPCFRSNTRGSNAGCRYRVAADRVPAEEETFVRLFGDAGEADGVPSRVAVRSDSKVELLEAEAGLVWDEGADQIELSVSEDIWLKVRIDGKEGWLHEDEDFSAIGLAEAG